MTSIALFIAISLATLAVLWLIDRLPNPKPKRWKFKVKIDGKPLFRIKPAMGTCKNTLWVQQPGGGWHPIAEDC